MLTDAPRAESRSRSTSTGALAGRGASRQRHDVDAVLGVERHEPGVGGRRCEGSGVTGGPERLQLRGDDRRLEAAGPSRVCQSSVICLKVTGLVAWCQVPCSSGVSQSCQGISSARVERDQVRPAGRAVLATGTSSGLALDQSSSPAIV